MTDQAAPADQAEIPTVDVETLVIDFDQITLGEMEAIERSAGRDFWGLFQQGAASRRMIALFLLEYRRSGTPPSWRELGNRRPRARSS